MNISPSLPVPLQPAADADRQVNAVQRARRTRDPLDDGGARREPARQPRQPADPAAIGARVEGTARPVDPRLTARANRALSAYASVEQAQERSQLQRLLGFDDYA